MLNRRAQPMPPASGADPSAARGVSERSARARGLAFVAATVLVVAALALLWLATPLREWVDVARLVAVLNRFGDSPWALPLLLGAYLVGGLVLFPVNVLVAVTVLVFGPLLGGVYAVAGSLASAVLLYEIGHGLRAGVLRKRLTPRLRLLGARLARRGLPAIVFVRIVPVAPYSVVNLVAGAARIRRRDYLLGTALGMLPGIAVNALFVDRIVALIERPQWTTLAAFVLVVAVALALLYFLRRHVAQLVRGREPA
jgi:uncharacterized membrane protein YdjX (TVP38/TMEM64 family)